MTDLFTAATGLFVAATIVYLIKRDRLQVRHGVSWMLVAAIFALFGFAPSLLDRLAVSLGVAYPPTVALVLGGSALIIKAVSSDVERSLSEVKITRIVQRLAMLEADIRRLEKRADQDHQESNDR
jgi:hypothetical protein